MIKYILDSQTELISDAGTTVNVNKALQHVRAKTYAKEFAKLKGRDLVPIDKSVPTGAQSVVTTTYEDVGEAQIIADYADDAPTVDTKASMGSSIIRGMQTKYNFSLQDMRSASEGRTGLPQKKANAAHRAIETLHDNIMLVGSAKWKFFGLFTIPGALIYTTPNGGGGSPLWSAKTPLEILEDMVAVAGYSEDITGGIEAATHLALPFDSYKLVSTTPMGLGYQGTILDEFKRVMPSVTVVHSTKLKSNTSWTGRRMCAYDKDPDKVSYIIPQEFEQLSPQMVGLNTWTYCHARTGGTVAENPKAITYADGI